MDANGFDGPDGFPGCDDENAEEVRASANGDLTGVVTPPKDDPVVAVAEGAAEKGEGMGALLEDAAGGAASLPRAPNIAPTPPSASSSLPGFLSSAWEGSGLKLLSNLNSIGPDPNLGPVVLISAKDEWVEPWSAPPLPKTPPPRDEPGAGATAPNPPLLANAAKPVLPANDLAGALADVNPPPKVEA